MNAREVGSKLISEYYFFREFYSATNSFIFSIGTFRVAIFPLCDLLVDRIDFDWVLGFVASNVLFLHVCFVFL